MCTCHIRTMQQLKVKKSPAHRPKCGRLKIAILFMEHSNTEHLTLDSKDKIHILNNNKRAQSISHHGNVTCLMYVHACGEMCLQCVFVAGTGYSVTQCVCIKGIIYASCVCVSEWLYERPVSQSASHWVGRTHNAAPRMQPLLSAVWVHCASGWLLV